MAEPRGARYLGRDRWESIVLRMEESERQRDRRGMVLRDAHAFYQLHVVLLGNEVLLAR